MTGLKSVSRHEEASAGGGSFAQQGGIIAQQNLVIGVSRTTCCSISTNEVSLAELLHCLYKRPKQ